MSISDRLDRAIEQAAGYGGRPDMVNVWTRDDLPHAQWLHDTFYDKPDSAMDALERIAVDLIDRLNEHYPKPEPDRWRRAHAIVEQERDQARESLRAVLDVCEGLEEAHRANPTQMYEYGMEEAAHQVSNAITAALGQEAVQ